MKEHLQFSQMVTASGKQLFIPLFLWPLMAGEHIPSILIFERQIQPNPSLVACSLDQWRIPSVRAFAAS